MLLYRWLKHTAFMNRKTRQYIGYALGEILLVIVGILIALQIDNWNSDRKDRATLNNYLHAIALNMEDDIEQLERLQALRSESIHLAQTALVHLVGLSSYRIDQVEYLNAAMTSVARAQFFNANTSSFDALKNSGVLDKLQGTGAEEILSRYYAIVTRVRQLEQDHDARVQAAMALPRATSTAFTERFAIRDPRALWADRFEELQPFYREYFSSEYSIELLDTRFSSAAILREYHSLLILARLFSHILEATSGELDDEARRTLAELDALERGAGYPDVIRDGEIALGFYMFTFGFPYYVDGQFAGMAKYVDHLSMRRVGDAFQFTQNGGLEWSVFSLVVRNQSGSLGRTAADFSRFERLVIEAKGAEGGERLQVHLKDADDLDDGSQTNIEIVLDTDWQTWEIPLADFKTADLSKLHLAVGFLMLEQQEPISFSVRTVTFR